MRPRRDLLALLAAALLGPLTACGASVDFHVQWPSWPYRPSPGSVDVYGTLEESGAVTLWSVHFDATAADIRVNGRAAKATDLQAGQVVHVVGTVHADRVTGSASRVDAESALVGPVWSVSPEDATIVAMGQVVRSDANTAWDPRLYPVFASGLTAGTRIDVHGWRNEVGEILATRIGLDDAGGEAQVVGCVGSVDPATAQFVIGGLAVDHGAASEVDVQGGQPAEGMAIVARGTLVGGTLVAREVRSVPLQLVQVHHLLP